MPHPGSDYCDTVAALAKADKACASGAGPARAFVHQLRAGRSALQQGDRARAHALLTRARTRADRAGDADTAREAQLYLTVLEESAPELPTGG